MREVIVLIFANALSYMFVQDWGAGTLLRFWILSLWLSTRSICVTYT